MRDEPKMPPAAALNHPVGAAMARCGRTRSGRTAAGPPGLPALGIWVKEMGWESTKARWKRAIPGICSPWNRGARALEACDPRNAALGFLALF